MAAAEDPPTETPTPTATDTPTPTPTLPPPTPGCTYASAPIAAAALVAAAGDEWFPEDPEWEPACVVPHEHPDKAPVWVDARNLFDEHAEDPDQPYTVTATIVGFDTSKLPDGLIARGFLLMQPDEVGHDDEGGTLVGDWFVPPAGACDARSFPAGTPTPAFAVSCGETEPCTTLPLADMAAHAGNYSIEHGQAVPRAYTTLRLRLSGGEPTGANGVVQYRSETPEEPPPLKLVVEVCPPEFTATPTPTAAAATVSLGAADLANCMLRDNIARGGAAGRGGGMLVLGEATLKDSSLVKNVARAFLDASGGGMSLMHGATGVVSGSRIWQNSARHGLYGGGGGGGITSHATLTVESSTISCNRVNGWGGGIFNGWELGLRQSTLSDNVAYAGGGLFNVKLATLSNCTLSGNASRGERGDAIFNEGGFFQDSRVVLTNCTLSRNRGVQGAGGIYTGFQLVRTEMLNTIIGLNKPDNCSPRTTSLGHNLDSDGSCFAAGGTDLVNTDPGLAPLSYYGGPLQTMALCTAPGIPHAACGGASPAIDAGDDAVIGPPHNLTADQRRLPRLSGAHVDIGAYEVQ